MSSGPRIAVMGGSLGGLTAALTLRHVGGDVDVYERSTAELEARGAGIVVLDETTRWFVEQGTADLAEVCTATEQVRYLDRDGTVVYERHQPWRFSSWNSVYRHLLEDFGRDRYHLGWEVTGFTTAGDHVEVTFASGATRTCDLLVCADGISSPARERLLPQVTPTYAGYVAFRGTVPEEELPSGVRDALGDALTYQLLDHSHILVYPIPTVTGEVAPGHRLMNFVWYRNVEGGADLDDLLTDRCGRWRPTSVPPGDLQPKHDAALRASAERDLAPPIATVVLACTKPFVQVIYDIDVPRMAFDRVCLIGDAAFAVRPHAAAGTAKAADDAWSLAEAIATTGGDVPEALRRWEPARLALGRALVERARHIGTRSQVTGDWDPADPVFNFGLRGPGD